MLTHPHLLLSRAASPASPAQLVPASVLGLKLALKLVPAPAPALLLCRSQRLCEAGWSSKPTVAK